MTDSPLAPWLQPAWQRFVSSVAEDRVGHGLLVAGEAGLGKRILVERMVARLLCQAPTGDGFACGMCASCVWREAGTHPDLLRIGPEEDTTIIKVAQVRALGARAQLTGRASDTRVIVVDPADAMNGAAQNALLKTLEEPPPGVHLLLVADTPSRLLPTIRSRCQQIAVRPPDASTMQAWLAGRGVSLSPTMVALAAAHPGRAQGLADPNQRARAEGVAADLRDVRAGKASALAVSRRWADEATAHVDDAIGWLRLWSWSQGGALAVDASAPMGATPADLARSYAAALVLRERLRTPVKAPWLIHEWLVGWQSGAR